VLLRLPIWYRVIRFGGHRLIFCMNASDSQTHLYALLSLVPTLALACSRQPTSHGSDGPGDELASRRRFVGGVAGAMAVARNLLGAGFGRVFRLSRQLAVAGRLEPRRSPWSVAWRRQSHVTPPPVTVYRSTRTARPVHLVGLAGDHRPQLPPAGPAVVLGVAQQSGCASGLGHKDQRPPKPKPGPRKRSLAAHAPFSSV